MKELAKSFAEEDATVEGQILKLIGGEAPISYTLDVAEVLLEPLFWLVIFKRRQVTMLDIKDDLGIVGRVPTAFSEAMKRHFSTACKQALTPPAGRAHCSGKQKANYPRHCLHPLPEHYRDFLA